MLKELIHPADRRLPRRSGGFRLLDPVAEQLNGHITHSPPFKSCLGLHPAVKIIRNIDGCFHVIQLTILQAPVNRPEPRATRGSSALRPHGKYRSQGAPSPRDVAELLWDHSAQASADFRPFADAFIFNWLVAGTDAHAKNCSFLLSVNSAAQQSSRSPLIAPVADTHLTDHHARLHARDDPTHPPATRIRKQKKRCVIKAPAANISPNGETSRGSLALGVPWVTVSCMSTITIPMPEEDLSFLRAYSNSLGTSAEAFLAQQAHNLRRHLQQPIQGAVRDASGTISPGLDAEQAYRDHLDKKHR